MTGFILWMGAWIVAPIMALVAVGILAAMIIGSELEQRRVSGRVVAVCALASAICHTTALYLAFAAGFLA